MTDRGGRVLAGTAAVAVLAGTALMIAAMAAGPGLGAAGYVSEAGAPGYPAAGVYRGGVLVLATGVALLGGALSAVSAAAAALLGVAGLFAGLSGAVACSPGCPLPPYEPATGADLVHGGASIAGMAAVAFAVLAVLTAPGSPPALRRLAGPAAAVLWPLSVAMGLAMLFLGRGALTGQLERVLLLVAAGWLVATATLRAVGGGTVPATSTMDGAGLTSMWRRTR